jgi:Rod binding domain-containing protein
VQFEGVGSRGWTSQSASEATQPKDLRLEHSAREFEASLMAELLKPLQARDGFGSEDSDSDSGAGSGGALSGFASESLAQAISVRGGFGIAERILRQLEPSKAAVAPDIKHESSETGLKLFGS